MSLRRDTLIVIDIEATCWQHRPPPGQQNEIIEIGMCRLDLHTGTLVEPRSILVQPQCSQVSEFCTALTSLTQAEVEAGIPFAEACTILPSEYDSGSTLWASWGDYDKVLFERQSMAFAVPYPFSGRHLNARQLFTQIHPMRGGRGVGMLKALDLLGLGTEGHPHRGVDDAWNLGRLLQHLYIAHGPALLEPYW